MHCLLFLKVAGFTSIYQTDKIKLNWIELHNYCKQNERTLFAIFDCKHILWKNELDDDEKKSLNKYVNNKLEAVFGIKISITGNNNSNNYIIKQLFII